MKFFQLRATFICTCIILFISAHKNYGQESPPVLISGNFKNIPATEFFSQIESRYDIKFYYQQQWFENKTISGDFNREKIEDVLHQLFDGSAWQFEIVQDKYIVFLPRDKVAMLKGKMFDYSNNLYKGQVYEVGDPAEAGLYKSVKLTGRVTDGKTGEPLLGTTVWIENTNNAVVSNADGYYSLTLAPGIYPLQFSNIGFEKTTYKVKVISNGKFDVELFQETHKIAEVAVYAKEADRNIKSTQMSVVELNARSLKQIPSLIGEKDILKSFTMMPGVQSVGEFGSGFNVRGGGEDQNLYLLEGAPIFNTSHLFGLQSVVNPDVVKDVTLYKGHIPSEFGERVSSVMDINLHENGIKKAGGKGGIGIYNSRLMFQSPVFNDHITLKVAGRSSYSDWLLKKLRDYNLQNSSTSFYDLTALLNVDYRRNKVTLFGYKSLDKFKYFNDYSYNYGNKLASLSWRSIFTNNFTGRLVAAYSQYNVSRDDYGYGQNATQANSGLTYLSGKYHLNYTGLQDHNIEGGIQVIHYHISPGEIMPLGEGSEIKPLSINKEQSNEAAAYINDKFDITDLLSFNLGLRFSRYMYVGPGYIYKYEEGVPKIKETIYDSTYYGPGKTIRLYNSLEPRLSVKIQASGNSSVKASYNRNRQFISLISYTSIPTPDDIWKLSDNNLKPILADQFAVGFYKNLRSNTIETSAEIYYKALKNLPEYKNDATIGASNHIETELTGTRGKNYGIELMVKKNSGIVEGWVSYTYSRSLRQTSGIYPEEIINRNELYASSYDKPHNLSIVTTYHINKRIRLTGTFNYSTGRSITLPEYQYKSGGQEIVLYSDRNKYRLPNYHRLDLAFSVDESLRRSKKWKGSWTFTIINVYARKNAYSVFYKKETPSYNNDYKTYSLYKLYIIGIPLPTITYNFIF